MSYEYEIVCLARSKKPGGKCVAGKILVGPQKNRWVRPVCPTAGRSITDWYLTCSDGSTLESMDTLKLSFTDQDEHQFQAENHTIVVNKRWQKSGKLDVRNLESLRDTPQKLWELGYSSYSGSNDRVSGAILVGRRPTLYLIHPEKISINVSREGAAFNNNEIKVRAHFSYNQIEYRILVTDPDLKEEYIQRGIGMHRIHPSYIVISLGEIHDDGYAYKLVANIIE